MGRAAEIGLRATGRAGLFERVAAGLPRRVPSGVLSVADQTVASATTFLTGALVGRVCSKEEFGLYTLGFSVVTLLMTVQASLIATPFMVRYPRLTGGDARRFAGSSLAHAIAFATLAALVAAGVCAAAIPSDAAPGLTFAVLGAAVGSLLLRDYVRQTCFARLAYGRALALDTVLAALQIAGLAGLYFAGTLRAWSAFLALGAACAVTAAHWAVATRGERTFSRGAVLGDLTDSWSSGKWVLASGLVWAVSMNLYAWIIAAFHGTAMAGTWAAALGVMTLINPLTLGIQNYLGPRIMHARATGGVARLRREVCVSAALFCAAVLSFAVAMAFVGDGLVTLIYGTKYAGNGPLVVLVSLNAAVMTVGFAVSRGLFALELAHIDFAVNIAALAGFLLAGIALVRWFGPLGAAAGQLFANTAATAIRARAFARMSDRAIRGSAR